jgi:hypothetical protein
VQFAFASLINDNGFTSKNGNNMPARLKQFRNIIPIG